MHDQNVNKVNTKATLRVPIMAPWIPPWAREYIKKSVSTLHAPAGRHIALSLTRRRAACICLVIAIDTVDLDGISLASAERAGLPGKSV